MAVEQDRRRQSSRPVSTVAPVVVSPEIDSNTASTGASCRDSLSMQRAGSRTAEHGPEQGRHQEAVADQQFTTHAAQGQPQQQPGNQRDAEGGEEARDRVVIGKYRDQQRRQHGDAEQRQQQTENAQGNGQVHGGIGSLRKRSRSPR
jgi:hypothetical protein